jgi:hypothetical protein
MRNALDQLYAGKYDECCAMLRAVAYRFLQSSKVCYSQKTAHAAQPNAVLH